MNAWFGLAGSSIASLTFYVWDPNNMNALRGFCWILSFVSAFAWYFSGASMNMPTKETKDTETIPLVSLDDTKILEKNKTMKGELVEWWKFAKELLRQPPFTLYVALNLTNFNLSSQTRFCCFSIQTMQKVMSPHTRFCDWSMPTCQIWSPNADSNCQSDWTIQNDTSRASSLP